MYNSANILWVIKWRRMRWVRRMARLGVRKCACKVWWWNLKERGHLENLDVDGRIILKCLLRIWVGRHGRDWSGSGYWQLACSCECGHEPLGSVKRQEISRLADDRLAFQEGLYCTGHVGCAKQNTILFCYWGWKKYTRATWRQNAKRTENGHNCARHKLRNHQITKRM